MRLLAICPRIRKVGGCVEATTAWRVRLLTLGGLYRKVIVDPPNEIVTVQSRYAWLFKRDHTIPFSRIQAVTYGFEDMAMDASFAYAHDGWDCFSVGFRLHDDTEFQLFSFYGEGTFTNNGPFPDWFYWGEFAFDLSGSQEQESRAFVELLTNLIGVSLIAPRGY